MKKTIVFIVVFALLAALAPYSLSENITYSSYGIGSLSFSVPSYYVDIGGDTETIFDATGGIQMRFDMIDATGRTLEESVLDLEASLSDMPVNYTMAENAQGLPFADCDFAVPLLSTYGLADLFLDRDSDTVYSFIMISDHEYTDDEIGIWKTIVDSINDPNIAKQNSPSPAPASDASLESSGLEGTSSYFDYDAIIADPDTYKDFFYTLVCDVSRIDDFESDIFNWEKPAFGLMSVDGNIGKVVYAAFDNPDDMIQVGDTVKMSVTFVGVTDTQTALGFYVKVPMFMAYSIEKLP